MTNISEIEKIPASISISNGTVLPKSEMFKISCFDAEAYSFPTAAPIIFGKHEKTGHFRDHAPRSVHSIGMTFVGPASVYGAVFIEKNLLILDSSDIIAPYVKNQMRQGIIDVQRHRKIRTVHRTILEPCIYLGGVGFNVFGHVLVDILPRLLIARKVLGEYFQNYKLLLPQKTPSYAITMMKDFFGVHPNQFCYYDSDKEVVNVENLVIPSLIHNNYFFHSGFRHFVDHLRPHSAPCSHTGTRVFVSRRKYRGKTTSEKRSLSNEEMIEDIFRSFGFTIVFPEELSMSQQIGLMDTATIVAGEAGSALHNSVFCPKKTNIISLGFRNQVQASLASFCDHSLAYVLPRNSEKISRETKLDFGESDVVAAIEWAFATRS